MDAGVPQEALTPEDFVQVRAALVRVVGGANEAIVWERLRFRSTPASRDSYEWQGVRWWAGSYPTLADETGLTSKQVRSAVDRLVQGGFLLTARHARSGVFDQTTSYAVVIRGISHLPHRADGSDQEGRSHLPHRADLLLVEEVKNSATDHDALVFAEAWSRWPRKDGKQAAIKAWKRALLPHRAAVLAGEVPAHRVLSDTVAQTPGKLLQVTVSNVAALHVEAGTDPRFVPHLSSWLNGARWTDPLPVRESDRAEGSSGAFAPGEEWMEFNR